MSLLLLLLQADEALLKTFRDEFVDVGKIHVAKYEVPQNLWTAVMDANPSRWKGPRNSVEMLSFDEAVDFCRKVTERLRSARLIGPDQVVRLPSETEWEHAARAGTTTAYSFGDDPAKLGDYAWYTGNAAGNDPPVGAKKPNPFGLYDVHGYLWEWCTDRDGKPALRGGSWKDPAETLKIEVRRPAKADLKDDAVGLRCVLSK